MVLLRPLSFTVEDDQPRPTLESQVGPGPLEHDEEAVAETDEIEDVDTEPEYPGEKAGEAYCAEIDDGEGAAHGGEIAFVVVVERWGLLLAGDILGDDGGNVATLLHSDGSDA